MKRFLLLGLIVVLMVSFAPAVNTTNAQDNTEQANKDALLNAASELSAGNPQPLYDLYAETVSLNSEEGTVADIVEPYVSTLLSAMPDYQLIVDVMIAQDDWVAVELTNTGTLTNAMNFFGEEFEATNQNISWTELDFMRFEDGKIVEEWVMTDVTTMFTLFSGEELNPDERTSGTLLEEPAGYQLLTEEELAATFASGMEERNVALQTEQLDLTVDTLPYYTHPYISWDGGLPISVSEEEQAGDALFIQTIAAAMPDYVVTADVVVAEGDWVAELITLTGTFTEDVDFFGTPLTATGEQIVWQIGVIDRYNADGIIVEEWTETDASPILFGLGLFGPDEGE